MLENMQKGLKLLQALLTLSSGISYASTAALLKGTCCLKCLFCQATTVTDIKGKAAPLNGFQFAL